MEPRVFILQAQKRYDTSAVKFYSKKLVYILKEEHISPFDTFGYIDLITHRLTEENFDPRKDFICLTGGSILLAIFLATLTRHFIYENQFKVLIFDARNNRYKLRILNLGK